MKVIGINGFGRIGRCYTRLALLNDNIAIALINDPADTKTLMHLLKYDSVHGRLGLDFTVEGEEVTFSNGKKIVFSHEKEPENIAWAKHNVETVIESSGIFLTRAAASKHLMAGAKRVILSAPPADKDIPTFVLGVNDHLLTSEMNIISNASCTTNNVAPLLKIIKETIPLEYIYMSTVHSYTSDQRLHDAPHKDLRRARAAATSIIPTTTGAAKAVTSIFPDLEGKITGGSVRVPVSDGSMSEITMICNRETSVEEINTAIKKATETELNGILGYTEDPIVSADILGSSLSCLFDAELTTVLGKLVKVVGWYDNEAGYSNRLVELSLKD